MTEPRVQLGPARAPARAEHELRGVLDPGELGERGGDVGRDDLVVLAAEVGEQLAVPLDGVGSAAAGQAVVAAHVHAEQLAVRARAPCARRGGSAPRCRARR